MLMYFKRATSVDKSKGPLKWSQVLISIHFGNASCSGAMSGECSGVKGTASGLDDSLLSGDIVQLKAVFARNREALRYKRCIHRESYSWSASPGHQELQGSDNPKKATRDAIKDMA